MTYVKYKLILRKIPDRILKMRGTLYFMEEICYAMEQERRW